MRKKKEKIMKKINWKKHFFPTGLFLIAAIAMSGCAGHKILTKPFEPQKMIHFSQLKSWDETKSLNNYVIFLNAGDSFPLALSMDTDFMAIKQDRIDIVAKQKLYFLIEMPEDLSAEALAKIYKLDAQSFADMREDQKKALFKDFRLYLSKDALHWAPMYSPKAIKEVLGFKSGTVSAGIMASTTDGLGASLILKTVK
jgi:hypothetical protein